MVFNVVDSSCNCLLRRAIALKHPYITTILKPLGFFEMVLAV
ncbi:MAG: hypothetical protein R8K49_05260 [Mariprofundaceae bacterium]